MRLYIAGPMRGIPFFNFPAFYMAERRLNTIGISSVNPAAHDRESGLDETKYPTGDLAAAREDGFNLHDAFRWDVGAICASDGILRLPGWESSAGATLEVAINKAIGGRVFEPILDFTGIREVSE